ncbi:MAG TPA: hypothetical protein VLE72_03970 [Candidatus Saccharimonadales bacterium]|nr:hypothetical protein [Candidatus Saccharimonadales bacterium]
MSDWLKIILTAAATLIGGMILFVFAEFARALVLTPLYKYREQVQLVLDRLDYYSNRLTNFFPDEPSEQERQLIKQIESDLRSAATQLKSKYMSITWRKSLILIRIIPSQDKVNEAYQSLIYLHNSILYKGQVDEHNNAKTNNEKIELVKNALLMN